MTASLGTRPSCHVVLLGVALGARSPRRFRPRRGGCGLPHVRPGLGCRTEFRILTLWCGQLVLRVPPPVELPMGAVGHRPAWEKNETDRTWQARGAGVQKAGGRRAHKVAQIRCRQPAPAETSRGRQQVIRRVRRPEGRSAMRADPAAGYVVPAVLRGAMFVPWQAPGRREPARVSAGAFTAAGLPVPEHAGQRNIYQLTRRQGLPWSPGLDAQIRRRGGELLGHGNLILVDIDRPAAVDGRPLVDTVRWLADRAVESGGLLDLSGTVSVRTPGHGTSGHLPGWHLWYRADPAQPVHLGPLARCHAVELRSRGTCPGSPGYVVRSHPDELPVLPRWIAGLAGPPPAPATTTGTGHAAAHAQARLQGIIARLLAAQRGE